MPNSFSRKAPIWRVLRGRLAVTKAFSAVSCATHQLRRRQTPPLNQLEEVVGGADDRPFGPHLLEAPHQELAEAARLFDLPKYRLGQLLTQSVGAVVTFSLDLRAHGLDTRRSRRGLREGCCRAGIGLFGCSLTFGGAGNCILGTAGRHIAIDMTAFQRLEVRLRTVARVG